MARAVDPSVVRIYLEGSRGKGSGTGFVVSQNDHVATNFHVVQPHLERGWAIYAYVCRLLPLTCLAPDIVEAIFDGRQPKGLRLEEILGNAPLRWEEQRRACDLA